MYYIDFDCMIVGVVLFIMVLFGLLYDKEFGMSFFFECCEIGIFNVGVFGLVKVGGMKYDFGMFDCVYIGFGEKDVSFENGVSG